MKRTRRLTSFALTALLPFFAFGTLSACDSDAEDAVEDVGEGMEDAADEVEDLGK